MFIYIMRMLEDHKEEGDIKRVGVRKSSKMANGAPQLLNFLNLNFLDKGGNLIRRPISLKTKPRRTPHFPIITPSS